MSDNIWAISDLLVFALNVLFYSIKLGSSCGLNYLTWLFFCLSVCSWPFVSYCGHVGCSATGRTVGRISCHHLAPTFPFS